LIRVVDQVRAALASGVSPARTLLVRSSRASISAKCARHGSASWA
jgi:hypothetical protein